jgi:hypothetical protein
MQDSAGCNGGNAADAWHYFHVHGLSPMGGDGNSGCSPYVSGKCLLKVRRRLHLGANVHIMA